MLGVRLQLKVCALQVDLVAVLMYPMNLTVCVYDVYMYGNHQQWIQNTITIMIPSSQRLIMNIVMMSVGHFSN